jgi:hypothetical protein
MAFVVYGASPYAARSELTASINSYAVEKLELRRSEGTGAAAINPMVSIKPIKAIFRMEQL